MRALTDPAQPPSAAATAIHLDAVGGVAGDMFAAALLDCFPELRPRVFRDIAAVLPPDERVERSPDRGVSSAPGTDPAHPRGSGDRGQFSGELRQLRPLDSRLRGNELSTGSDQSDETGAGSDDRFPRSDVGELILTEGLSGGLRVCRFGLGGPVRRKRHGEHDHVHDHTHPHQDHTDYRALRARIERADLAEGTAAHALAILAILAEAEARIHAIAVEDVAFHEIGDWDSLMDVVAAGSIAAALARCRWTVSPLPRGSGLVKTAHGLLPVPAPATLEILTGFEWRDDGVPGERVTPTGAAILRHLCAAPEPPTGTLEPPSGPPVLRSEAPARLLAVGTGAGTRDLPGLPNILRATAFAETPVARQEDVLVVSFDIDDMTGEEIGLAADRLRGAEGVLDLTLSQPMGKKGRPVCRFELLAVPTALDAVAEECFRQTSTIGLRWRHEQRRILERRISAESGVRVKTALRPGKVTAKAESDDLAEGGTLAARRALARRATGDVGEEEDTGEGERVGEDERGVGGEERATQRERVGGKERND